MQTRTASISPDNSGDRNQFRFRSKRLTNAGAKQLQSQTTPVYQNHKNKRVNCKTAVQLMPQKQQSQKITSDQLQSQLLDQDYQGKSSGLQKKRMDKLLGKNNKPQINNKQTAITNMPSQNYSNIRGSSKKSQNKFSDSKSENSLASAVTTFTMPNYQKTGTKLTGKKRQSQISIDESERKVFVRKSSKNDTDGPGSPCQSSMSFGELDQGSPHSKNFDTEQKKGTQVQIKLKSKKFPTIFTKFRLFQEKKLEFMSRKNKHILDFDMTKLELEYDYDTDEEQIVRAKSLLMKENLKAIDFFVKEEPILLVGNTMLKDYSLQ